MAKSLKDILTGVKSSKTVKPDLKDLAMSPEGNKGELEFAAKHDIEKHADRVGNDEKVYAGGTSKTTKYKFQKDGVYEETSCNRSGKGVHCEMHGEDDCSSSSDKEPRYKGKKLLTDKKQVSEGRVEDVAHKKVTKQLSAIAKSSNVPVTKVKPGKKQYNELKSTGSMFGGARTMAAGLAKRDIEATSGRGSSVGKAIVKEDEINEVAPPNPKIEKWIKANKERFVKEYGKEKGTQVLYAKAWKMHGQSESGGATNTDYTGGTLGSTGRLDVGTL
jgi:hypothetical protein